jgi:hypothetical protein
MPYAPARRLVHDAPRLAAHFAGARLELVELTFGPQFEIAVGVRTRGDHPGLAMLARALHIDGEPLGLDGLRALPGFLGAELNALMLETVRMHADPLEDDVPAAEASANDATAEGAPPGESRTRSA